MSQGIDPLLAEMGRCAEEMQRLIDALDLRHHDDHRVRDASTSLHTSLSQIKLRVLDQKLKAVGR